MDPWEMRDAVEDGVRRAHGLPPRKDDSCLQLGLIGCAVPGLIFLVLLIIYVNARYG